MTIMFVIVIQKEKEKTNSRGECINNKSINK